jgi:ribonuclease HI
VVDHPPTKDFKADETRVNLHAARDSLDCAIVLQAQYQFTHGYACDATKTEKQSKDSEAYYVVARAALRHDGEMLGGRLLDSDELLGVHDTTSLGEKAATDDALADAVDDGTNSRVLLWIDSISHVQCLRRFLYSTARRKQNVHAAGRYAATADLLAQLEVVCYHWQTSHVGCPASEAADLAADASAEAEVFSPVIEPIYSFASMLFPRDETSPRHWAVTRCDAAVAALLRACSVHTVYPEPGDVPLVNIPEADDVLLASVRAERCFHSDGGLVLTDLQRERRAMLRCPWGCDAECRWEHFCFECDDVEMVESRLEIRHALRPLFNALSTVVPHDVLTEVREWIQLGDPRNAARVRNGWPATRATGNSARASGRLQRARRAACGYVNDNGVVVTQEIKDNLTAFTRFFATLFQRALQECNDTHAADLHLAALVQRVFTRYVRRLAAAVVEGGPARVSALRCGALYISQARSILPQSAGTGWRRKCISVMQPCCEVTYRPELAELSVCALHGRYLLVSFAGVCASCAQS